MSKDDPERGFRPLKSAAAGAFIMFLLIGLSLGFGLIWHGEVAEGIAVLAFGGALYWYLQKK